MIGYAFWLIGRLIVVAFALVTWAYCVSTFSPFAFDMFIQPQLFPWLETLVNWHHLWYLAAFGTSVATLVPDIVRAGAKHRRAARLMALLYIVVFLAIGVYLVRTPYLRMLSTDTRQWWTPLVALVPLAWLAVIDMLATGVTLTARDRTPVLGHRRLLLAAVLATGVVWITHFGRALLLDRSLAADRVWLAAGAWGLALDFMAYAALFALLCLGGARARTRPNPGMSEFYFGVVVLGVGIAEFFRRLVFPSLAFTSVDGLTIAGALGLTLALAWCGFRMRRAVTDATMRPDVALLLSPAVRHGWLVLLLLATTPLAALALIDRVEHLDWDFVIQKSIVLTQGLLVFGLSLRLVASVRDRGFATPWIVGVPIGALVLLAAVPASMQALRSERVGPEILRDRYAVLDPAFRLTADAFIEGRARDAEFATAMRQYADRSLQPLPKLPAFDYVAAGSRAAEPLPHVFIFVIDGLRRDYLSAYNPAVTFTPGIGEWATDALVFQNAFTKYGGTWLAMPSIWSGAPSRRGWTRDGFEAINSLERFITSHGYRLAINDYTVAGYLRKDTVRTFIDPGVKSVNTDICTNVAGIQQMLAADRSPLVSFVAPMNVYVLNTAGSGAADEAGFNVAYSRNVARVDSCFGEFVAFLKREGLYDNSVIAVTSDHGESLGEHGNWGHQFWLFPEDMRVPFILSLPPRLRAGLTADLGRVAFSSDLVATLYRVLGHEVRDLGHLFGAPLVAPAGAEVPDRRRESFLLMSSYGASYGMLRRNGKLLYISDLINYREYAYELFRQPIGNRVRVTDDARRVNQALIRRHVAEIEQFYQRP